MEAASRAGPTVEDAVRLAERGFHVFPCKPGEKEPATFNGYKDASNDPEKVRQMFAGPSDYNIGLVPGRSGHVVVDVDSEDGEAELRRLWEGVPDTVSWTTGRGRHRLYRTPAPLKSRTKINGADLDVRGCGGYAIAPPSLHPNGARYSFEKGTGRVAALTKEQAAALAPASKNRPAPPQEELQAPSLERLSDVVAKIPNAGEQFASRDAYRDVGYAIKAAAGPGNEGEALELFQAWASRWEDGENDPETVKADWSRMHPPYRIGWSYLLELAGEIHTLVADEFDADEEPDLSKLVPAEEAREEDQQEQNPLLAGIRTAADLVAEDRPELRFVVDGVLAKGRVGILAAPPKKGKSTLARHLATAVAAGEDWCGLPTSRGRVLYVALEEHWHDVADDFEAFGGADADNLDVYVGRAPEAFAPDVLAASEDRGGYDLIIVDTIFRAVRTEDGNAYADTTETLDSIIDLAHRSGAHVLCIHHTRKGVQWGKGDPFEGILGSQGIWASFDVGMMYLPYSWGEETDRILIIDGRRHVEGQKRAIYQDPSGELVYVGSYSEARALALHDYLNEHGPESYEEVSDGLGWGISTVRRYMDILEDQKRVKRRGEGVKGDPYRWAAVTPETAFNASEDVDSTAQEGET